MKSIDIAIHLLRKSIELGQKDSNYYMDFIKLHKLMFLCQCYFKYEYGLNMFEDKITANGDGPYIEGLNSVPAICGFSRIKNIDKLNKYIDDTIPLHLGHILPLPALRDEICDLILDIYGKCDTSEIVKITKNTIAYKYCYSKNNNNVICQELLEKTGEEISKIIFAKQRQSIPSSTTNSLKSGSLLAQITYEQENQEIDSAINTLNSIHQEQRTTKVKKLIP